jgi:transposase
MKAAISVLDNIVVKRPLYKMCKTKQNLCLDKGYDFQEIENSVRKKGYCPHIPHRGEQTITNSNHHNHIKRRWVVERTNSWHNRLRKLLVRYEKKIENYFALVCLGCCILIYRRIILGRLSVLSLQLPTILMNKHNLRTVIMTLNIFMTWRNSFSIRIHKWRFDLISFTSCSVFIGFLINQSISKSG